MYDIVGAFDFTAKLIVIRRAFDHLFELSAALSSASPAICHLPGHTAVGRPRELPASWQPAVDTTSSLPHVIPRPYGGICESPDFERPGPERKSQAAVPGFLLQLSLKVLYRASVEGQEGSCSVIIGVSVMPLVLIRILFVPAFALETTPRI